MTDVPEILMFMKQVKPWYTKMLASVAATCQHPFTIHIQYDTEATAFKACNDAIKRSTSRYVCICDDDVEFLEVNWLLELVSLLKRFDNLACVVPYEIKNETDLARFHEVGRKNYLGHSDRLIFLTWVAGYVSLFDREKVPHIYCDEGLPGKYGMSDMDLCLQVRDAGYDVGLTTSTIVAHLLKPLDPAFRDKYGIAQEGDTTMHEQHVNYMASKWGQMFLESYRPKALGFVDLEG